MNRNKTVIIFLALSTTVSGCIDSSLVAEAKDYREVLEVVDGDTVKVNTSSGNESVRLVGVDTPEISGENTPEYFDLEDNRGNVQCLDKYGFKAANYTEEVIGGEVVVLKTNRREGKYGEYGRRLAYVEYKGKTLGERLLEEGMATVYPTDFQHRNQYREIEEEARQSNQGVWRC